MKNLSLLFFCALIGLQASAQKNYFAYFESEGGTPFFIKLQDKLFSSSSGGYIIIPDLRDSTYSIAIGFPSSQSDLRFRISMNGKDRGFLLKQFDFGWGLFDMQSLSILKPLSNFAQAGVAYRYRANDFTTLLARASNDTSLFYVPIDMPDVAVNADQQKEPEQMEIKPEIKHAIDSVGTLGRALVIETTRKETTSADSFQLQDSALSSVIEKASSDSFHIVKATAQDIQQTDSMSIFAPPDSMSVNFDSLAIQGNIAVQPQRELDSVESLISRPEEGLLDTALLQEDLSEKTVYKRSEVKRYSESSTSEGFGLTYFDRHESGVDTIRLIIPNPRFVFSAPDTNQFEKGLLEIPRNNSSGQNAEDILANKQSSASANKCDSIAQYSDFFQLRKTMAAMETDEEMVEEARKRFATKCFSTEQIRNLSTLFLTAAGKYLFFEASQNHITDKDNFPSLGQEIRDAYFSKRFKALTGE